MMYLYFKTAVNTLHIAYYNVVATLFDILHVCELKKKNDYK